MDIIPTALSTQDTIHRPHEDQEDERQKYECFCPSYKGKQTTQRRKYTDKEAETEGKAVQRLPRLGIHPVLSHQRQTLLWMPTSAC